MKSTLFILFFTVFNSFQSVAQNQVQITFHFVNHTAAMYYANTLDFFTVPNLSSPGTAVNTFYVDGQLTSSFPPYSLENTNDTSVTFTFSTADSYVSAHWVCFTETDPYTSPHSFNFIDRDTLLNVTNSIATDIYVYFYEDYDGDGIFYDQDCNDVVYDPTNAPCDNDLDNDGYIMEFDCDDNDSFINPTTYPYFTNCNGSAPFYCIDTVNANEYIMNVHGIVYDWANWSGHILVRPCFYSGVVDSVNMFSQENLPLGAYQYSYSPTPGNISYVDFYLGMTRDDGIYPSYLTQEQRTPSKKMRVHFTSNGDAIYQAEGVMSTFTINLDISVIAGVDEIGANNKEICAFPNPSNSFITIKSPFPTGTIMIYAIDGSCVKSHSFYTDLPVLDIQDLAPGIYTCVVNGKGTARFVKN